MKNLLKLALSLIVLFPVYVFAQMPVNRIKIDCHVDYFFAGKEYPNIEAAAGNGLNVSYFLTDNWLLTAHWNIGASFYAQQKGVTESTIRLNNVGLLAGYYQPITKWFSISAHAGFSQLLKIHEWMAFSVDEGYEGSWISGHINYNLAMPVKINIGFKPFKFLEIGATAGCHLVAYPSNVLYEGFYIGPQISVLF